MNLITASKPRNLVRADSEEAREGFRTLEEDESSGYFVSMNDNSSYLCISKRIKEGESIFIAPDYILVFNLQYNVAGLVKADEMVEPVNLTVNIGEKE